MRRTACASSLLRWCHIDAGRRDLNFDSHRFPWLRQPEFSRTAVIINEFGEVGLDHELVETSEDSFIELKIGCLCCKVRTDLAQTIQDMLQRRDDGNCSPFNRIVIETSGLADPAPILQTLMTDTSIAGCLVLGGVVATVDTVTGISTLQREDISQKQVAVADRIVLTKLDLGGPAQPVLLRRLAELNAGAPVLSADGADLLRLKGIVNIAESPDRPAVIHGVQHVFHAPAWLKGWPSDNRSSRIVFITRRVPQRWVEALFEAIGAEVADVSVGR
jgi:G3E family GTPase